MNTNKNHRHYYAAHSYMGLNYTYDSPCWSVYAFDNPKDRDEYVNEHCYANGNLIMETIDYKTARKIAPELRNKTPDKAWRVIHVYQVVKDQQDQYGKWHHETR